MLLLFAHGLTVARGGARDCVGVWPDTVDGLAAAMARAEVDWHDGGPPAGYEWCGLYRVDGGRLRLVATRGWGGAWVDRFGEPFAQVDVTPG